MDEDVSVLSSVTIRSHDTVFSYHVPFLLQRCLEPFLKMTIWKNHERKEEEEQKEAVVRVFKKAARTERSYSGRVKIRPSSSGS
ncbi:uncharacterized [Tachysurus ichikawai]